MHEESGVKLEQWQLDAIQALLSVKVHEVEEGKRVYSSSKMYGESRYHLIDRRYDGVQIEQVDIDEKWNKGVNLYSDEVLVVLKALLVWHLEEVQRRNLEEAGVSSGSDDSDDSILGDLDNHPF